METLKRKERSEAHYYMSVEILTDDDFQHHHKSELYDNEEIKGRLDLGGAPCTSTINITVS